jgi:predicted nucleotidyltransferase
MNVQEIQHKIAKLLPELREKYGVREVWLFGSVVRGDARKESDLDILVEFDNPHLSLLEFIGLEIYLSEILGVEVDLVEKNTLKPAIGKRVIEEAIPV